ncbi:MAG: hypothetical protein CMK09_03575 [Ponticaulis sp.]|nr:hypothetical protein [Ponticaulis sp.]
MTLEVLDGSGTILDTDVTTDMGEYSVEVPSNTDVRIRAKAEVIQSGSPSWDMQVLNNTNGNALYAITGSLTSSGGADSTRDLNAPSGWDGSSYASTRAAAPFAILDPLYEAITAIVGADADVVLPELDIYWSPDNVSVSGDVSMGEIGTTSYGNGIMYVLGDEDSDTDEYDRSVLTHEYGHYLEDFLSRSDSIGGGHGANDFLDPRLAWGEGFANAFSGMILGDPIYSDSLGAGQAAGGGFNLESSTPATPGWFNEFSVQAFVYDVFDSSSDGADTLSYGFQPIYDALTDADYTASPYLLTIFTFADELIAQNAGDEAAITTLKNSFDINGTGPAGTGETNDGGLASNLPVFKTVTPGGGAVEICSVDDNGDSNKLGVRALLFLTIASDDVYTFTMTRTSGPASSDPDFRIIQNGTTIATALSGDTDTETTMESLSAGEYSIAAFDWRNIDSDNSNNGDTCFDFTVTN